MNIKKKNLKYKTNHKDFFLYLKLFFLDVAVIVVLRISWPTVAHASGFGLIFSISHLANGGFLDVHVHDKLANVLVGSFH